MKTCMQWAKENMQEEKHFFLKYQKEILDLNTISKMRNSLDLFNRVLNTTEQRNTDLERAQEKVAKSFHRQNKD